jgi:hypothetical protein
MALREKSKLRIVVPSPWERKSGFQENSPQADKGEIPMSFLRAPHKEIAPVAGTLYDKVSDGVMEKANGPVFSNL